MSSLERHLQTLHGTATHFDKIGLEEEFRVSATKPLPCPEGLGVAEEPRRMAKSLELRKLDDRYQVVGSWGRTTM